MSNEFNILLFGPGLPTGGRPATCRVEQNWLSIPDLKQTVAFSDLQAKVGSFDHNQLQLTWQQQDDAWLLIPADKNAQKSLVKLLADKKIAGMGKWRRSTFSQSLVWKTVAGTLCALALAAMLVVWQHDVVATWLAGRVSLATENEIGQAVLSSLKSQASLVEKGISVDAVKKIGDRLTKGSAYKYQWHVANDPAINAFALPGGIVIVNKGLIEKADSANELAGVLAHEIQHVEQRHALKNMINSAGIAAAMLLVLGDANAVMMVLAHKVSAQYFSRQTETDADMKGVALLHKAKVNPNGLPSFFKKMQAAQQGKSDGKPPSDPSTMMSWLSSHPDTGNRIKAVEEYNKDHPCQDCETLSWDKKAILASLPKDIAKTKQDGKK